MMMAIAHGKSVAGGPRGRPPKSIADKYTDPGKDAPEQSGEDRGGTWSDEHHKKHSEKSKKHLKKSFEDYYKNKGVGCIVMDSQGRILMGKQDGGKMWSLPGGHVDKSDTSLEMAALRELKEETGLEGKNPAKVHQGTHQGNDNTTFLVEAYYGKLTSTPELKGLKWIEPHEIEWDKLRSCCVAPLKYFVKDKMGKSLKGMMALEVLEKNHVVEGQVDDHVDMPHSESLKLVGNGLFRQIRHAVEGMTDESFRDVKLDTYGISIRKHLNDSYSGRVSDGHKIIYQFTNKTLPELTVALMSVFEWYLPEDEKELEILDESALNDDAIHGGLNSLISHYKKHNIGNIYEEMETIRETMRNGMAVDLQQIEGRIMTLFDKLESVVHDLSGKHNKLADLADSEITEVERKLRELQVKLDEMEKRPQTVEAFSANPANPNTVHDEHYGYLPRPSVEMSNGGKIKISFSSEWTSLDKENFLNDLRARVIKKVSKDGK